MGIKWKGELEYGTSGNYEDEDDSSFDDYLKGISKSTDNEEVDKDVVDMSDAELDSYIKLQKEERDSRSGWWFTW
jgi:hypothetical protein